jgi:hypothetical protein
MPEEDSNPPKHSSSWAEWVRPSRWLAFAQRVLRVEHEMAELKEANREHAKRIRELERLVDRQGGQLDQMNRYIETKVSLELSQGLDRLAIKVARELALRSRKGEE